MPKISKPREGSLAYWPRKRTKKFLPRVNWDNLSPVALKNNKKGLLGFICYKSAMVSVLVKDNTQHSMTKGKNIIVPCSILSCPPIKIFSLRFYKDGKVISEINVSNDKELKKKLKLTKKQINVEEKIKELKEKADDLRVIVYSLVKREFKKTPDLSEIAVSSSNLDEKIEYVKKFIGKEIRINDIFNKNELIDIHGLTKGKGLVGPVKRFGLGLKFHKTEKGVRGPGTLGPWTPSRVTFRAPLAGQLGMFTRAEYNKKIVEINDIKKEDINLKKGFENYGLIKTDFLILKGSVSGPEKRQLIITSPLRKTKSTEKENFEYIRILN
ncbi:50S ribosomal protein L3 [Candidatus Pacearchaeota archaeon CG_4_9_14_3_um_filter_31_7]|nr:MAG: 50S ribosomal protein L3 [Candidatus Pacearchaeota archaeon CG1_02_31_27]PIN92358.1 MAG: 50S ribosomal protein L3 [Candidatus Pacearchaeota archaeon CG10_big_fil_rev_8_21_14_0_10_31_59]PIZ80660.1 MAG: 50S ribosomal protein L3 [Candidatus Pacearchaeota archaeon CG_4_10_14_0_2_um_filter_31_10]PJA70635.1 MAG: 50S ribosomal protein L3 [Candidatus Pacearchaeota archaeon CG_4_9_14_3_um_filter_31_7]